MTAGTAPLLLADFGPLMRSLVIDPAPTAGSTRSSGSTSGSWTGGRHPDASDRAEEQLSRRGAVRATVRQATERAAAPSRADAHEQDGLDAAIDADEQAVEGGSPANVAAPGARAPAEGSRASAQTQSSGTAGQREQRADQHAGRSVGEPLGRPSDQVAGRDRVDPQAGARLPAATVTPTQGDHGGLAVTASGQAAPRAGGGPAAAPWVRTISTSVQGERASRRFDGNNVASWPRGTSRPDGTGSQGVRGQAMRGVFALLRSGQPGSATAYLKLAPESLGEMKISLSMERGRVTAVFAVTSDEAQTSLREALPELRQALESRGLIVDEVQVQRTPDRGDPSSGAGSTGYSGDEPGLASDSRGGSQGREASGREARDGPAAAAVEQQAGEESPEGGTQNPDPWTGRRLGVDLTA